MKKFAQKAKTKRGQLDRQERGMFCKKAKAKGVIKKSRKRTSNLAVFSFVGTFNNTISERVSRHRGSLWVDAAE